MAFLCANELDALNRRSKKINCFIEAAKVANRERALLLFIQEFEKARKVTFAALRS